MSEQLYRIKDGAHPSDDRLEIVFGFLVPVEPCEHGMNDGHMIVGRFENGIWISDPIGDDWEPRANWCEGAGLGGSDE